MKVYHGTSRVYARKMIGPPSKLKVSMGRGELGTGFYAGESIALASAHSYGRYGRIGGCVIQLLIDESEYVKLQTLIIKKRSEVLEIWKKNKKAIFNTDVVVSPFFSIEFSYQYKFESLKAELLLNSTSTKKRIL